MTPSLAALPPDLAAKYERLRALLAGLERAAVAFSGGVDSSFLLATCLDVLGPERVLALTADSPLLPRAELRTARAVAARLGVTHRVLPFDDLAIPEVAANPPRRCYHCKRARFEALLALLRATPGTVLLHGENADDHLDYRPGLQAAQELGVRAPLAEAGLTKSDIRELSRRRELPTWDQPAAACLATRFAYDTPLTRANLERVERAEEALHALLGRIPLRLRDHWPVARLEVPPEVFAQVIAPEACAEITARLRALGYRHVTLDLEGYRMGGWNATLSAT